MPKLKRSSLVCLALLACAVSAFPQRSAQELDAARRAPGAFTIDEKSIVVKRLEPTARMDDPAPDGGARAAAPGTGQLVNAGLEAWRIIEQNKPEVDVRVQYASALPRGAGSWRDMSGWKSPQGTLYSLTAKNIYGAEVIRIRYQVLRTWGGSYRGRGKYLTAVTVEPLLVQVAWGYRFSLQAFVPGSGIVNVGTAADPVAGMTAALAWRISTPLKDLTGQSLYFLQGDGAFREVGGPFLGLDGFKNEVAGFGAILLR